MADTETSNAYGIEALLLAAECIDRRDKVEHGYAVSAPDRHMVVKKLSSPMKPVRKPSGNRCTHNELEKNRRAHLRSCLERLKTLTPMGSESARHTTLGLLTKARVYIKALEEQDRRTAARREHLMREQRLLRLRIEEVTKDTYRGRGERTVSECSVLTNCSLSTSGHSSLSELASDTSADSEEIDILGESDSDDSGLRSSAGLLISRGRALTDHGYGLSSSI